MADAAQDARRACIAARVAIDGAVFEAGSFGSNRIAISVTNGLGWAIAGLRVRYEIASDGRSVPWLRDTTAQWIPGGIEPGETRALHLWAGDLVAEAPADVTVTIQLLDLADALGRQFVGDVRVNGGDWSTDPSEMECETP